MSELSDTEKMERVNREMKRNQIVARIQDSFGRLEIDALMCRALESLHLANSEIRSRLRDLGNDKYTSSRWQVSPPQADLASRHVLSLIELRLNSWLMVSKCCNEALGEESPEHDDPLYKLIGHHASYAAYIESLRRAMDSNRRMQREPREPRKQEPGERASRETTKQEPQAQARGGRATGRRESTAAGDDDLSTRNRNGQCSLSNSHDESPAPGNDGDSPSAQAPGTVPHADYDAVVGDWMENANRWLDEPKGPAPELPSEVMLTVEQAAPTDERSAMMLDAIRFMSRMQNRKNEETARSGGTRPQVPA
jgi:hypothetical protein